MRKEHCSFPPHPSAIHNKIKYTRIRIQIRIRNSVVLIRESGSLPKCHRSSTLANRTPFFHQQECQMILVVPLSMQLHTGGGGGWGGTIWYKLARRRTNILHKQSGWVLLRRIEKFLSAEMAPNSCRKLRFYAAACY